MLCREFNSVTYTIGYSILYFLLVQYCCRSGAAELTAMTFLPRVIHCPPSTRLPTQERPAAAAGLRNGIMTLISRDCAAYGRYGYLRYCMYSPAATVRSITLARHILQFRAVEAHDSACTLSHVAHSCCCRRLFYVLHGSTD